jgi:DNA-binding response OmpR family regulator
MDQSRPTFPIIGTHADAARVLVVEDEMLIQMLAVDYLESFGFKADTAGTATDAVKKLRLAPGGVDAAVVDVGLPDRKGDVLVGELRALDPTLRIVIASGYAEAALRERFKNDLSTTFLDKPYTGEELIAALRTVGVSAQVGL